MSLPRDGSLRALHQHRLGGARFSPTRWQRFSSRQEFGGCEEVAQPHSCQRRGQGSLWSCAPLSSDRCEAARWSESQKAGLSTDCTLQLECMKSELLVIVDQQATVNTFPGLVHTARHTMGVECSRSGHANPQGRQVPKECLVTGVKS